MIDGVELYYSHLKPIVLEQRFKMSVFTRENERFSTPMLC